MTQPDLLAVLYVGYFLSLLNGLVLLLPVFNDMPHRKLLVPGRYDAGAHLDPDLSMRVSGVGEILFAAAALCIVVCGAGVIRGEMPEGNVEAGAGLSFNPNLVPELVVRGVVLDVASVLFRGVLLMGACHDYLTEGFAMRNIPLRCEFMRMARIIC